MKIYFSARWLPVSVCMLSSNMDGLQSYIFLILKEFLTKKISQMGKKMEERMVRK